MDENNSAIELDELVDSDSSDDEPVETPLARWIPAHINKRVCNRFTTHTAVNDIDDITLCHCGYAHKDHIQEALENYKVDQRDWGEKYTTYRPSDAFGELRFPSNKGGKTSKFARVDSCNNLDAVLTLLLQKWALGRPNLVISMLGGAKQSHIRPAVRNLFRTGLMTAAERTGAWIMTRGTHDGIVKQIGEALRDYREIHTNMKNKIRAIGIVAWGTVSNRESLVNPNGCWPVDYYEDAVVTRRTQYLDPNHSHFLFIDDGTQHNMAVEFPFRIRLENYMQHKPKGTDGHSMPVVCLVIEGGRWTLEGVRTAVKHDIPVVIVQGSGRIADILAYAYTHADEVEVEEPDEKASRKKVNRKKLEISPSALQDVKEMLKAELGASKMAERLKTVNECLESPDFLTVFSLENDANKLDEAILQALIKGRKGKKINRLKLALAWNRADLAKKVIFNAKVKWQPQELHGMLYTALEENKVQFVNLFRNNNVSTKDFLTCKRLLQLYNAITPARFVRKLLIQKKDKSRKYFSFVDISKVMQELLGDFFYPFYSERLYQRMNADTILDDDYDEDDDDDDDEDKESGENPEGDDHAGDEYFDGLALLTAGATSDTSAATPDEGPTRLSIRYPGTVKFDNPCRELFLWAIVVNRLEMSRLFWRSGQEAIAAALTAQGLLKALSTRTPDPQVKTNMEDRSRIWANQAVGVLNRCFRTDANKTYMLLTCVHPDWGNSTIMSLAVNTNNRTFIAHAACQTLLNKIWKARKDEVSETKKKPVKKGTGTGKGTPKKKKVPTATLR